MELTLGPLLFEWKKEEVTRFYEDAASLGVDRVYVGEVVCTRKWLKPGDIAKLAEGLAKAGKKVVASSLAVVSNEEELAFTREIAKLPYAIEANDMSVFNMVEASKKEVYAGPHITSYNVPSIEFLKSIGVKRVTFPVELSKDSVACCIKNTGIEGEVFAHGKVPLAFSWRCYTSRAYNLSKTECKHDCVRHPDGMELRTVDGEGLFTANGTSILSASVYTLVEHVEGLREIGVKALRISPQREGTPKIIEIFRKRIDGKMSAQEGLAELKQLSPALCNGWYHGAAGKDYIQV